MATVFLATDLRHKRSVALKVLHPELADSLGPERFRREIETVARLQHPHILTVHDSGEVAGQLWFTMPFVEGESLRERLRREPQLPVEVALRIASDAARALQYAHDHGVVHRDIKPENLLLTTDGSTLVADFGIARALSEGDERLTETGLNVGTPAYMSPEQAVGDRTLDGRTDVYSLGTVLYEMLAGEPPFTGATVQTVIAKRLSGEVPRLRHARPSVPESIEQAVTRALAPLAADRFTSAGEFARALQPGVPTPTGTPTSRPMPVQSRARRRVPLAALTLGLGILIGLGVLFAWRQSHHGMEDTGDAKVLAVLPFENLGDSSDAYFAEGVGDEVRGKLSQLAGLAVIARASSNDYGHTRKPLQQIAKELGADYLLTGTVQWLKHPNGTGRVRVSPELVHVSPSASPKTTWQQAFDMPLSDVLDMQADIAGQVAQALNVALGDSARRVLEAKPTLSVPAYDAYLRGRAAWSKNNLAANRQAVAAFEQAVALDSTFIEAWTQLAEVQGRLYAANPTPAAAETVRRTAERAMALAPTRSEAHEALGAYYGFVLVDNARALKEDSIASALAPGNADLLVYMGWDEAGLGRWEAARMHFVRAVKLDPRSRFAARGLGNVLLQTRRYKEAEQAYDHALQVAPATLADRVERGMVALAQGDLAGAQAILKAAPREVDPTELVAYVASNDLVWVLEDTQQQLLLRLRPSAFNDDRGIWGNVLAQAYALRGDLAKTRVYADSAKVAFEEQLVVAPKDPGRHAARGLALAYLGRKDAAVLEGQRAVALMPVSRDASVGPYIQHQLARIYLLVNEQEKALDQLEPLLKIPYSLSPAWLKIDPDFAPLRGNPRFDRLVNGS
jgi:serine/threonine-protein kinase